MISKIEKFTISQYKSGFGPRALEYFFWKYFDVQTPTVRKATCVILWEMRFHQEQQASNQFFAVFLLTSDQQLSLNYYDYISVFTSFLWSQKLLSSSSNRSRECTEHPHFTSFLSSEHIHYFYYYYYYWVTFGFTKNSWKR